MDFFVELKKLQDIGPRLGMLQLQAENSEYTFATDQCRNCYLIMNAVRNEDCMYGRDFYSNDDCVDCDHISECELCYDCVNCKKCYNSNYLQDCENVQNCEYGYDLKACEYCIGCVGLRRKQYHIFNVPYSKEEYARMVADLSEEIRPRFEALKRTVPREANKMVNADHCLGNYVYNSKNVFEGFDISNCEDGGYLIESKGLKDCFDITILEDSELCYEIASSHKLYNCNFCYMCVESSDLEYCEFVAYSKHCFGCVSLVRKEYHILNQPYSPDEYFKKVAEIKDQLRARGEYGTRFLPSSYPEEDTVALWERM